MSRDDSGFDRSMFGGSGFGRARRTGGSGPEYPPEWDVDAPEPTEREARSAAARRDADHARWLRAFADRHGLTLDRVDALLGHRADLPTSDDRHDDCDLCDDYWAAMARDAADRRQP